MTIPAARYGTAMAYDPDSQQLIMFGARISKTWEWTGSNWTPPAARRRASQNASLAYDTASGQLILFGGINADGSTTYGTTYTYDGTTWTALSPSASPPARWGESLAYDPATSELVLFGGGAGFANNLGDVWTWNGTTWSQVTPVPSSPASAFPSARNDAGMDYDAATGQMVMFSGIESNANNPPWSNDTWLYLGP